MIDVDEISKYPMCDTDIWVNLCLGNMVDLLFKKYKKILIADVVAQEILPWKKSIKFKYIYDFFKKRTQTKQIIVIHHQDILPEEARMILEMQLYDIGFSNGFKNIPKEDHKGEIVSAIYADYFEVPFLKSDDNSFKEKGIGKKEFPDLKVKDWYVTTEELIPNFKDRIRIRKIVEKKNVLMNSDKKIHKENTAEY